MGGALASAAAMGADAAPVAPANPPGLRSAPVPGFASGVIPQWAAKDPLVQFAERTFPNLSTCEAVTLYAAARGENAICAPGLRDLDHVDLKNPDNNPADGFKWAPDRSVRADLLRWMLTDGEARKYLDPSGIQIRGARISGLLNLSFITIPAQLGLNYCFLPGGLDLGSAKAPGISILNSYSGPAEFGSIDVDGSLVLLYDTFYAGNAPPDAAVVDLTDARLGFLNLGTSRIFAGDRPHGAALAADLLNVRGSVFIRNWFVTDGIIRMNDANIGVDLDMSDIRFVGKYPNGLMLENGGVKSNLWWVGVTTTPKTTLDLIGTKVGVMEDDPASWPAPGNLLIDGFVYGRLACPSWIKDCAFGAASRLKWLALQKPGVFYPQPYRQMAAILLATGDRAGERKVLIEAQNQEMRWGNLNRMQRVWGWVLWATIDYGYESSWALVWAAALTLIGGVIVRLAHEAGVMKPAQPERKISSPMIYSLDVFLPIVDLRLQHNWWPDPTARGAGKLLGLTVPVNGAFVRAYLWIHIIAGYILTALFVAGLSGLVHKG